MSEQTEHDELIVMQANKKFTGMDIIEKIAIAMNYHVWQYYRHSQYPPQPDTCAMRYHHKCVCTLGALTEELGLGELIREANPGHWPSMPE